MPWVSARALSIVNIDFTVRFGPITCLLPFDWNDLDLMLPLDRGRENQLDSVPPPSEPDMQISRIRLSG